ncbi:MAG: hypothetical protein ACI91F_002416 [Candidatus Binatia bacterium]|jgi:hypothetical protein
MKFQFSRLSLGAAVTAVAAVAAVSLLVAPPHAGAQPSLSVPNDPEGPAAFIEPPAPIVREGAERRGPRVIGGVWSAEGPAPITEGQVENVTPDDVVIGAIHTAAAHPTDVDTLYIGATNGGIWKTTNSTAAAPSWTPTTDDQPGQSIGALEFDPTDGTNETLVAGIGRYSSFGRFGSRRLGLLRTTNGAGSWTLLDGGGTLAGVNVSGVAPRGSTIVLSVNTDDAGFCSKQGIFRSTDTGATFSKVAIGSGVPEGSAYDLASDPTDPTVLYTAVIFADVCSSSTNGFFRSADTGATWTRVSDATMEALMTNGTTSNAEISVGSSGEVYATVINVGQLAGLFRSTDGGGTWVEMDQPKTNEDGTDVGLNPKPKGDGLPGGQGGIHHSLRADPVDSSVVYMGGDRQPRTFGDTGSFPNSIGALDFSGRLFRCDASLTLGSQCVHLTHRDDLGAAGGGTASSSAPHADSREIVFDANGDMIETDDGGVYRRTSPEDNTGDWFALAGDLQVSELHDAALDARSGLLTGGCQDTGSPKQLTPGGSTWESVSTGDGGDVSIDSFNTPGVSTRYSSFQYLQGLRRETYNAAGVLQTVDFPALTTVGGGTDLVANSTGNAPFRTPMSTHANDGDRFLVVASDSVYESFDQGETVTNILDGVGSSESAIAYGGSLASVDNDDFLLLGLGDEIYSRSAGIGSPALNGTYPGLFTIRDVTVDRDDWTQWFVADSSTVYASTDAGATWSDITGNLGALGATDFRALMYISSGSDDVLAIGTREGVFASTAADFSAWDQLGTGLPTVAAYDLDYHPAADLLIAGTMGRGAWSLGGLGGGPIPTTTTTMAEVNLCGATPELPASCRLATTKKSLVKIGDNVKDDRDKLIWKWTKGDATDLADFGEAVIGTNTYQLCIYDASVEAQPLLSAKIESGGTCGSKPCWKALGTKGFAYKNKGGVGSDGAFVIKLMSGVQGKPKVLLKGKGLELATPALPLTNDVVVQLLIDAGGGVECWQTTYSASIKNETKQYKAKGP